MEQKKIKNSVASEEVKNQKAKAELNQDIKGYFGERDKTNRGNKGLIDKLQDEASAEAEVKELLYQESIKEVAIPEYVEPMFNEVFLTARRNKVKTDTGLIIATALSDEGLEVEYQEVQKVMAAGPQVQQALKGSEVAINFENLRKYVADSMADKVNKKSEIKVPLIEIEGRDYIRISERDLKYIVKKVESTK